ncbi:hypothetical protein DSAG12_00692 [Promethearchaeum syntrophicum]|uniref:Uncharacterized protein n=1 Tax=Promethearchaeum syntrophicum TaxID=2594042 RepID=A0A5B9D7B3_9ARCH|nr:hypothetical protein [Candidatus Prometheoarchaeum syntrophicum]QEE14871.1 hypothetical protein DSAG12_00692 [Candidatus Prometheoarchaeum syntrophicum]
MTWKSEFLQKFTFLCQKFHTSIEFMKELEEDISNYDEIILHEFSLSYNQRRKGAIAITLVYLFLINLVYIIFSFSLSFFFIFITLGLMIYIYLLDIHKNFVQFKENSNTNKYHFLSLQMNIILLSIKEMEDKNLILMEILEQEPEIGINIRKVLSKINLGHNIKNNLKNIIFYSPSFNVYFRDLLESNYNFEIIENIDSFQNYYENKFEIFINSLDTRLSLFFFFNLFFPIGFLFMFSINSLTYEQVLIAIFLFILIQKIFIRKILNEKIQLIGGINSLKSEDKKFLKSFLKFFYHFSNYLSWNPPELALYQSILKLSPKEKSKLNLDKYNFSLDFKSLNQFLKTIFLNFQSSSAKIFYTVIKRIFRLNSSQSPNLFRDMSKIIHKHMELGDKQEIAYNSSYIKVIIFKILLVFILGILTPIIYRFQEISQLLYNFNYLAEIIDNMYSLDNYFLTIFISLIFIFISIQSFNEVYNFKDSKKLDYFLILMFFICLITSTFLWNSLIFFS